MKPCTQQRCHMMCTRKPSQTATCKWRRERAAYRMQADDMRHARNGEYRTLSSHGHAPHPAQDHMPRTTDTMQRHGHNHIFSGATCSPTAHTHYHHAAYRITAKSERPDQPPQVGFSRCPERLEIEASLLFSRLTLEKKRKKQLRNNSYASHRPSVSGV